MNIASSKVNGKQSLKGNWGLSIGAIVLYTVTVSSFPLLVTPHFSNQTEDWLDLVWAVLFTPALGAGLRWLHLGIVDGEKKRISHLFDGFKLYGQLVAMNFLKVVIAILWAIIPTMIAASVFISPLGNARSVGSVMVNFTLYLAVPILVICVVLLNYSQATYLFRDHPQMGVREALSSSKKLMQGRKASYFGLNLGYVLWYLPSIIALYIAWYQTTIWALAQIFGQGDVGAVNLGARTFTLAIVYGLGISVYIVPKWHIAMAAFHRTLAPLKVEEENEEFFSENTWIE